MFFSYENNSIIHYCKFLNKISTNIVDEQSFSVFDSINNIEHTIAKQKGQERNKVNLIRKSMLPKDYFFTIFIVH